MASLVQDIIDEVVTMLSGITGINEVTDYVKLPEEIGRPGIAVFIDEGRNDTASEGNVSRKPQLQLICIGSAPDSQGMTANEIMSAANAKIFQDETTRRLNGKVTSTVMVGWKSVPPSTDRPWTAVVPTYELEFKSLESAI